MSNPEQIDIKAGKLRDQWLVTFPYHEDFIAYIKFKVPSAYREYDGDTKTWTIYDPEHKFMPAIESIAVQKFRHAIKTFYNPEGKLVIRNMKNGVDNVLD